MNQVRKFRGIIELVIKHDLNELSDWYASRIEQIKQF
jgi:hypothetical protein